MSSCEQLAVDYFCDVIQRYKVNCADYRRLSGHLGQASIQVRKFLKKNYPGALQHFFEEHDEFFVSSEGYVSKASDVENEAVDFLEDLFDCNTLGVIHYSDLDIYIDDENYITEYIFEYYPDDGILSFFEQHEDIFSTANEYVTLLSERDLNDEEKSAVIFFLEILEHISGDYHYNDLWKYAVEEEESEIIITFINDCYPKDQFFDFLVKHDDVFFVDCNGLVFLRKHVDDDAVKYFKDILADKAFGPVHYTSLYGHVGQAPYHIVKYINECFGRNYFVDFFVGHSDIFTTDKGCVTYIGDEAADYFINILKKCDISPHYINFRGHIAQAPRHVMNFINVYYPGENFHAFLLEYPEFSVVDGYVSLTF